ncbi:MAG: dTMP kinase [Armatimonadetes bacterium]|nr:dTMP kinase [Armatimonadota bacterium]
MALSVRLRQRFIVFEGVEGSGKSTQMALLAEALSSRGLEVVTTFEPGATPAGRRIREVLLGRGVPLTPLAEMMLFCADRAQHVHEVVRPALEAGKVVLSDRYEVSTIAYQGYAGGVGVEVAQAMNEVATGGLHADLTLVLDLDPREGLRRKGHPQTWDRMETKAIDFHDRVREGFLRWAERHPEESLVLDATWPAERLHRRVLEHLGLETGALEAEAQ